MRYLSTRGNSPTQSFCDILLGGLAPDGGLYLPESYPLVTRTELDAWRQLSYAELAFAILSKFIDDIPPADLKAICDKTYTAEVYCNARPGDNAAEITPVHWLEKENGKGSLGLLELSNGPTLAFKDMAMQLLGNLFEYVLAKRGEEINILGATSGDTGSAAEYAMRGKNGVRVFMLSPHGRMSAFQRAQMYSLQDPNIFNIAVTGMFDDAQDIVKAVSNDHAFKAKYKIGAVNSINWGRVAAQIVYYFKGYFAATGGATGSNDEQVAFCVPSGNFGNICAGHIARMMGLPVAKLILATNENDVLDEFFRTGVYRPRGTAETHTTSSPSMDISKASNFERFVFDLVSRDGAKVRELWAKVDAEAVLDWDLFDTRLRAEVGPQPGELTGKLTYAPGAAIGAVRTAYPRWVLVPVTATATPAPTDAPPTRGPSDADTAVVTLAQQSPAAPWLMVSETRAWGRLIPVGAPGADATADQLRAATVAAQAVGDWLTTGTPRAGLDVQSVLATRATLVQPEGFPVGSVSCSLYRGTPVGAGVNPAVRAVTVGDSLVASASYRCERILPGVPGQTIGWKAGWDRIYAAPVHNTLRQPCVVAVVLVSGLDGSAPTVAGARWGAVLP